MDGRPASEAGRPSLLDRRDLILAFIGAASFRWSDRREGRVKSLALGDWVRDCGTGLFADLTALRRLGAIYLAAHPEERSHTLLSRLLIAANDCTIPSQLLSAVARDWSSNHVVLVDGWLLARSEARLCALLHLEQAARA